MNIFLLNKYSIVYFKYLAILNLTFRPNNLDKNVNRPITNCISLKIN